MIKINFKFLLLIVCLGMFMISCGDKKNDPKPSQIRLSSYMDIKLGWGKGRESHPGYLSVSNGEVRTFMSISTSDEATQRLIDIVFPGDWGSSGGKLTIAAPSSSGAGAAAYEYCKEWRIKKSTQLSHLSSSFDKRSFDDLNYVSQLQALEKERRSYYTDWMAGSDIEEGRSFIFKTEEGHIGIAYIHSVNGTYGGVNSNLTISIKLIPQD